MGRCARDVFRFADAAGRRHRGERRIDRLLVICLMTVRHGRADVARGCHVDADGVRRGFGHEGTGG